MPQKDIYFDSAATSFPKPEAVVAAMASFLASAGNPGRGAHQFALRGAREIFQARESIAEFLGIKQSERLIFTSGCTASLNMVVRGLAQDGYLARGDMVLVSALEHNSLMRPLAQLKESGGINYHVIETGKDFDSPPGGKTSDRHDFAARLADAVERLKPKLVALTAASNVTGEILPIQSCAELLKKRGIPLLVDAAQTAGEIPYELSDSGITFFATSGHKGLLGPPGVGLLYIADGWSLSPIMSGGTGSRSESLSIPAALPDRLEPGTLPGPAIAGLSAGVECVRKLGPQQILEVELSLAQRFLDWAAGTDYIQVFGPASDRYKSGESCRMAIVSFRMRGVSPAALADVLDTKYGIAVRAGLHCSALCHKHLGTLDTGLVRASFSAANSVEEVDCLVAALEEIAVASRVG